MVDLKDFLIDPCKYLRQTQRKKSINLKMDEGDDLYICTKELYIMLGGNILEMEPEQVDRLIQYFKRG